MTIVFYSKTTLLSKTFFINILLPLFISLCLLYLFKKLYQKCRKETILTYFGRNSLGIYLFHCYFTAFNRSFLIKIGITNFYINFICNFIISFLLTLLLIKLIKMIKMDIFFFKPASIGKEK